MTKTRAIITCFRSKDEVCRVPVLHLIPIKRTCQGLSPPCRADGQETPICWPSLPPRPLPEPARPPGPPLRVVQQVRDLYPEPLG
jgi:hypothetical protein